MQEIWIATSDKNKVREFRKMFQNVNIIVKSLLDLENPILDIPKTGTTFEENFFCKADFLSKIINKQVLTDDSGLEIIGLDHFPVVNTRRWAYSITDNRVINKLLIENYKLLERRDEQTVCVLCYIDPIKKITMYFRVVTMGIITDEPMGENAFGYDPIFLLPNIGRTYAELT